MNVLNIRLLVIMVMMTGYCFSQEKKEYIPDGTQGEQLEVLDSTKLPVK